MAKAPNTSWEVLPHGPLQPLADNLYFVSGELPGMPLRRGMTVVRLHNGDLLLHSAIAMGEEAMAELEALGRPAWLVVPNGFHRIDAPRYKARYPDLRVVCPRGARKAVEKVVGVDVTYDGLTLPGEAAQIEHLDGLKDREGVLRVVSEDGVTLVFNDAFFNVPHGSGLFWLVYGRLMGNAGGPRVTSVARMVLVGDKKAYGAHLARLAETPDLKRLVPGHGDIVDADAAGVLRRVAATL